MKECVYGHYPPAQDPWTSYRKPPNAYDQECLFKHWSSKYNDRSGVPTPEVPTPLRPSLAVPAKPSTPVVVHTPLEPHKINLDAPRAEIPDYRQARQRAISARSFRPPPSRSGSRPIFSAQRPSSCPSKEAVSVSLQIEGRSASPVRAYTPASSIHSQKPRPATSKPWAMKVKETQLSMVPQPPSMDRTSMPQSAGSSKPDRVKSASVVRPRVSPPQRPTKSADPRRRTPLVVPGTDTPGIPQTCLEGEDLGVGPALQTGAELDEDKVEGRPESKLGEDLVEKLGVDQPLDYDEQVKKHGWRMEIPGDPLNLKRPCIAKRESFTVSLTRPTVAPDPPGVHIESSEPYFYNTIPRQPMSFTIHQDWASEVLLAKRLELQKRDGDKYRYRQNYFSFIY